MIKQVLFFFFPLFLFSEIAVNKLSLNECIQRSKENYITVEMAALNIDRAVAQKNQVRSALLPQLSLDGVWDNRNQSLSGDLTQFQNFHSSQALGLSVQQQLWDFGVSWKLLKAGNLRIDVSKLEKESALLGVEEMVKKAFITLLEKKKIAAVFSQSLATLKQQLERVKDLEEQGIITYSDKLSLEVQLSEREKQELQAHNACREALMQLNRLIGNDLDETFEVEEIDPASWTYQREELVRYALANRPDIKAIEKLCKAKELEQQAARWSHAPKFYLFGNGNYSSDRSTLSAGMGMQMPLYEGGKTSARISQLRAENGQLHATLNDIKTATTLEINRAYILLDEAKKNFELDKKSATLAKENLRKTIDLYTQGLVSVHDLLLVEDQLNQTQTNCFSSFYNHYTIIAHLVYLSGGIEL